MGAQIFIEIIEIIEIDTKELFRQKNRSTWDRVPFKDIVPVEDIVPFKDIVSFEDIVTK